MIIKGKLTQIDDQTWKIKDHVFTCDSNWNRAVGRELKKVRALGKVTSIWIRRSDNVLLGMRTNYG